MTKLSRHMGAYITDRQLYTFLCRVMGGEMAAAGPVCGPDVREDLKHNCLLRKVTPSALENLTKLLVAEGFLSEYKTQMRICTVGYSTTVKANEFVEQYRLRELEAYSPCESLTAPSNDVVSASSQELKIAQERVDQAQLTLTNISQQLNELQDLYNSRDTRRKAFISGSHASSESMAKLSTKIAVLKSYEDEARQRLERAEKALRSLNV